MLLPLFGNNYESEVRDSKFQVVCKQRLRTRQKLSQRNKMETCMFFSIVQKIIFAQISFYYPLPGKTRTSLTTRIERTNLIIQSAGYIRRNTVTRKLSQMQKLVG